MEGKEYMERSGIMKGDEVPGTCHVAARTENPSQFNDPMAPVESVVEPEEEQEQAVVPVVSAPPGMVSKSAVVSVPPAMPVEPTGVSTPVNGVAPGTELKKRGRPRKYGPDGKPLSPMPISASFPLTGELLTWKPSKSKPVDSFKKKHKLEFESPGSQVAYSVGANFTPHVITVNAGEDVSMKIISFSQQGSRVICILAANGSISNVTLRQPNSSGGTLTYEGRFEILSLSGSFMPTDSGGTKSRTGGMSVSLAGPDGRVLGGGLAGLLVAAGPVQVVIGSFLPGYQQEQKQKPKKQKFELAAAFSPIPSNHTSGEGTQMVFSSPQQSLIPATYLGNNLSFGNSVQGSRILGVENNVSLSGEPKDVSQTKFMVTC